MDISSQLLQYSSSVLEPPLKENECMEPPNKRAACETTSPIEPTSVPLSQSTSVLNESAERSSLMDIRSQFRSKFMAVVGPILDVHLRTLQACSKTICELREESKTLEVTTFGLEEIIRSIRPSTALKPVSIVRPCQLSPPNPVSSANGLDVAQYNGGTITAPSGYPLKTSLSAPALAAMDAGQILRPLARSYPLPTAPLPAWSPPNTPLDAQGHPLALGVQPALHLVTSPATEGVCLRWDIDGSTGKFEPAVTYELFNYTSDLNGRPASADIWKKISDIGALPLPMTCTLSSLFSNVVYYFAMRSVDRFSRYSNWSNIVNASIR